MAVIVDPPLFLALFDEKDERHGDFIEVLNWVIKGPAKFVVGGTKYKNEIYNVRSVMPKLAELSRARKIYSINDTVVDAEELRVKRIEPRADFDDPHLVALVCASKVKIICIKDPRAHKFLRRVDFYPDAKLRPKLFTRAKNRTLLIKDNLKGVCYS